MSSPMIARVQVDCPHCHASFLLAISIIGKILMLTAHKAMGLPKDIITAELRTVEFKEPGPQP